MSSSREARQIISTLPWDIAKPSGNTDLHSPSAIHQSDSLIVRSDFHVRVARTHDQHQQVNQLIERMYRWRGYTHLPAEPARPGDLQHATLQACQGPQTVGTLSLHLDSSHGLLADWLYRKEIDGLRSKGAQVCELTGLAVDSQFRSMELLASLFHLLHLFGHKLHGASDAVIEVNPRHVSFYQRLLGFRQIGELKVCERVQAPAVLLHVKADYVERQIERHAANDDLPGFSLYPYFFSEHERSRACQRLIEELPELHGPRRQAACA